MPPPVFVRAAVAPASLALMDPCSTLKDVAVRVPLAPMICAPLCKLTAPSDWLVPAKSKMAVRPATVSAPPRLPETTNVPSLTVVPPP